MRKKYCNACGTEIPTEEKVATLEHNEAAKVKWGTFSTQSGVLLLRLDDLCETCATKTAEYIDTLKKGKK